MTKIKKDRISPSKKTALSLLAIMMVMVIPAGVAMLDASASIETQNSFEYDEESLIKRYRVASPPGETWDPMVAASAMNALYPSATGGTYIIDTGKSADMTDVEVTITNFVRSGDVKKIVITTDHALTKMVLIAHDTGLPTKSFTMIQTSPGVFEYEFSNIEELMLKNYPHFNIKFCDFTEQPVGGFLEFGIDMYDSSTPIYIASYVLAAVGLLLIICAIYATKWVNVGTVTGTIGKAGKGIKSTVTRKGKKNKGGNKK